MQVLDKIDILNHGEIELWDVMGDDTSITDAARVSYADATKRSNDRSLIRYCLSHGHCYHPEMEVLTSSGWKQWGACNEIETFIVPNPQTNEYTLETLPLKRFEVTDENMFCYENNRMSYCVTSNHRMFFKERTLKAQSFQWYLAKDMPKWGHFMSIKDFLLKKTTSVDIDPEYLRLLGFYLGDGCRENGTQLSFRLKKVRKINYLKNLLTNLKVDFKESIHQDGVSSIRFYIPDPITSYLNTSKANDKSLSISVQEIIETFSIEQIQALQDGLLNSDGSIDGRGTHINFSTTSNYLLKLFEVLTTVLGYDCHEVKVQHGVSGLFYSLADRSTLESIINI